MHDISRVDESGKESFKVTSVTFLVAVNQTETPCLMTSKTQPLKPGILHNKTDYIYVGKCDYGALDFNITTSSKYIARILHIHITQKKWKLPWEWELKGS